MKAVVMAGGEGTRLRPLTCNRPKPLVPIANKPVMEHIIELLKKHGITQIVVTLHYLADEIVGYFGDGSDWGIQIIYSVEDEPLGTAGSVKKVEQYLDDTFIIISGDALTDFDLTKAINFHKEKEAVATITLTRVENPLEYGVVITDEAGKINRFLEKPSWGEVFSDTINTGIYILEPEIFSYMEQNKVYDFSKDLFPKLLEKDQPLYGFVTGGYWCDIGNLQQYRQSHYDMFTGKVKAEIPGKQIEKGIWVGEGTEIHPSAQLQGPVVIGKNCRIKENVYIDEFTAIGDNSIIEEGSTIHRGIIWNNVYIGKKARISGSTICRQCTLKSNVVISEGVVLGDKCFIGQGSVVHPQVKIWPDKSVEAGATVSMSLVWGIKWPGSLFGETGISGLANIEITPEFALKLGAAYGAFMEKSAIVCTSRDSHPASRMLNRSIICGLISVGVNVFDLRVMPAPISRYTIKNSGVKGGIHTRISPDDPRSFLIEFYDSRGINIDKGTERKIENLFFREDFRRTAMDEVGTIDFPSRAVDEYIEGFFNLISADTVKKAGFKVVIDYAYGNSSIVLPLLLGKLGCETVAINAYLDAFKAREIQEDKGKSLNQLSNIVMTLDADLGILMDVDAEKFILVDEKGNVISNSKLLVLLSLLIFKTYSDSIMAVPVTQPRVLEEIASKFGGKIIRTKTDGRSLMHTASLGERKIRMAGTGDGAFTFPQFQPAFDGMFAFAKILELMAKEKTPLSELASQIPPYYTAERKVECAWQQKGKIMRKLIEENRDKQVEMTEGIKVYFDGSWILAIPDPSEPMMHLYAEAASSDSVNSLIEEYARKIDSLTGVESFLVTRMKEKTKAARERVEAASAVKTQKNPKAGLTLAEDKAFHFWNEHGHMGVRAVSLKEFADIISYIDISSIEYHVGREDFANWVESELEDKTIASKIRNLQKKDIHGEQLRQELIKITGG